MKKNLVVISYYDRRPSFNLITLLQSMETYPAGASFDICIVVNRTQDKLLSLPSKYSWIPVKYRNNTGMNIGAWDYGWRLHPGYQSYMFLQDECYFVRKNWLKKYLFLLENTNAGMIGESINKLWDRPWSNLRSELKNSILPEHSIQGKKVNRVDFYLDFFKKNTIQPGKSGRHLRSVIWCFSGIVIEKLDGFLIGLNYGECIGAEIAASQKVEFLGYKVLQSHDEEFHYIRHLEYNQDYVGAPFSHNVKYVNYASVQQLLKLENKNDRKKRINKFKDWLKIKWLFRRICG